MIVNGIIVFLRFLKNMPSVQIWASWPTVGVLFLHVLLPVKVIDAYDDFVKENDIILYIKPKLVYGIVEASSKFINDKFSENTENLPLVWEPEQLPFLPAFYLPPNCNHICSVVLPAQFNRNYGNDDYRPKETQRVTFHRIKTQNIMIVFWVWKAQLSLLLIDSYMYGLKRLRLTVKIIELIRWRVDFFLTAA